MAIVITRQPTGVEVAVGKIAGSISVVATGATTYQWKAAKSSKSVSGATNVPGATGASMTIPTDLAVGEYYFFCNIGDGSSTKNSEIVTVSVVDFPKYLTGNQAWTIIESMDNSVAERYAAESALSGITIPRTDVALRTVQIELLMTII